MTLKPLLAAMILLTAACSIGPSGPSGPIEGPQSLCRPDGPATGIAAPVPSVGTNGRLFPTTESGLTPAERLALDDAFARAVAATQAATMTAAVWQAGGSVWSADFGDEEGRLHYWASVGKIVTAAAVMRLAELGLLDPSAPVDLPADAPPGSVGPTPADLMAHVGGIDDTVGDAALRLRSTFGSGVPSRPVCRTGYRFRYANSGYALLGDAVAAAADRPFAEAAQDLVLDRSAAPRLRMLSPEGWTADTVPPALPAGAVPIDIGRAQGAGGLVGDAESIAILLRDLLAGRIVAPDRVARMLRDLHPMDQPELFYGRGLMVYAVPEADGPRVWIGHSGGVPGAKAVVAYDPALNAIAAVALTGDGSAEATAALLFRALDR